MKTRKTIGLFSMSRLLFCAFVFLSALTSARAGFLYVLNENINANQIWAYNIKETTGVLTQLPGMPVASGGFGLNATVTTDRMTLDRVNHRLYVVNDGSDTITAFSIDSRNGALTPLPFSPITLPAGPWSVIAVHPSGSPLIVGNSDTVSPGVASFNITAATATAAAGSPFPTGTVRPGFSCTFSRAGDFLYLGSLGSVNVFTGFSVNESTGVLTALPGSPYDSGAGPPTSFAADADGRLFLANYEQSNLRAFTTTSGVPNAVSGNPLPLNAIFVGDAVLHPNEKFYYIADRSVSRVESYQITGSGAATTLTEIFPRVSSGGMLTNMLAINDRGNFMYSANANTRNITTYNFNPTTGRMAFGSILGGNSLGTTGLLNGIGYLPTFTAPFDFDGDNKTDLSIFRPSVGEWWYLKSTTGGNGAAQFGAGTDRITPGDFTGDAKADIAFFRPDTGFWFVLRSEDFSFFSFPFGANGDIPTPSDFDGDGKNDAAIFRPSETNWYISRSSGGTTIQQFGANGDVPVPADYDGDGRADIAIYRPSVGEWWVNRSSNGTTFALQFGTLTDKPVQGDYTGDGKADIAFWRPSTGEWFILRSEDLSFFSFPFGANGDVSVPGDYDGDGKFDAAVFRPWETIWYVQRSTAGTLIQQFGSPGDKPVPGAFVP